MAMPRRNRPVSAVGANYSNFFHSGLRAVSSHVRSFSTPVITQSSSAASSSRSSLQRFRSHGRRSTENVTAPRADASSDAGCSLPSEPMTQENAPKEGDILMIKGVPSHLKLSHPSNRHKSVVSPSGLVSLDPLAPSPCPTASSFFIELSEASSTDSSPSFIEKDQDESFLSLSTPPGVVHPYACGSPLLPTSRSSRPSSVHTTDESFGANSWLRDLDVKELSESNYCRWDALSQSAADAHIYHPEDIDDDWRQFHADWIQDAGTLSSPPGSPL